VAELATIHPFDTDSAANRTGQRKVVYLPLGLQPRRRWDARFFTPQSAYRYTAGGHHG